MSDTSFDFGRNNFKPCDWNRRMMATIGEKMVAKHVKGKCLSYNHPFDVEKGRVVIEVKTLLDKHRSKDSFCTRRRGDTAKVVLRKSSSTRKKDYAKENSLIPIMVVVDMRDGQHRVTLYYRSEVGSFRIKNMERVSWKELERRIDERNNSASMGAGRSN